MYDRFNREIKYLRLSVTDLCNYRCMYCMDEFSVEKKSHSQILSIEELSQIARAAYYLGITKIRITGGEPLVRKGIIGLCENIRSVSDDIELCMTTNGSMLGKYAKALKAAGVDRLNISLDTLDKDKFARITRGGDLGDVLDGIKAAIDAGFSDIKINTVLIKGFNDDEISDIAALAKDYPVTVRFIELMPIGVCALWNKDRFISADKVIKALGLGGKPIQSGVAAIYDIEGYRGKVGVISPLSGCFCPACDKIRVTADGKLKPCLYSDEETDLKGLEGEALIQSIQDGIERKPLSHRFGDHTLRTGRNMNEIGG